MRDWLSPLERENETLKKELDALRPVVEAALQVVDLWLEGSGDFTPHVGYAIDALWRATQAYERSKKEIPACSSTP